MNGVAIKRILTPLDFSDASVYALGYAKTIAEKFDAKLYLYHCITDISAYSGYVPSFPADDVLKGLREDAIKNMEHIINRYSLKNVETAIEKGNAAKNIVYFAEKNKIDLIVMGAHGKSGFERFTFGSTTEKVMRMCTIPVLEVKMPK